MWLLVSEVHHLHLIFLCLLSRISSSSLSVTVVSKSLPNRRCLNITFITHRFSLALLISDHSVSTEALDKPELICSPFFPSFPQSKFKFLMWVLSFLLWNDMAVSLFFISRHYMILEILFLFIILYPVQNSVEWLLLQIYTSLIVRKTAISEMVKCLKKWQIVLARCCLLQHSVSETCVTFQLSSCKHPGGGQS